MKSSELVRLIMEHSTKKGQIVCLSHGSQEVGRGLERKIKKDAGLLQRY